MDFLLQGFFKAIELLTTGDPETFSAVYATLVVSAYSLAVTLVLGLPLGFCLGYFDFSIKKQVRVVVDTLLALPTVFIGLLVYAFFTNRGPLGEWGLLFTLSGIAVGLTILALPVVIALSATAVESMDRQLRVTLISLGANRRQLVPEHPLGGAPRDHCCRPHGLRPCHDRGRHRHDGGGQHQMADPHHHHRHRA